MWVNPDVVVEPILAKHLDYWTSQIGPGWYKLIERFIKNVDYAVSANTMPPVQINDVKEKFGTLRIYFSGGNDLTDKLAAFCEDLSSTMCEECGKLADMGNKEGWFKTLCVDHK